MPRPTQAVVDLSCIAHNIEAVRTQVGAQCAILVPVKADAYGHGAVPVARLCEAVGVDCLGVATLEEGAELRHAGIGLPVLILGTLLPEDARDALHLDVMPSVCGTRCARAISTAATAANTTAKVFVNIDTGMGRVGCHPWERAAEFVETVQALPGVRIEGVFSHFPAADEADRSFASEQLLRFNTLRARLLQSGIQIPHWSMANSGAVYNLPESYLTMVRPGIMIYGYPPSSDCDAAISLEPAMTLRSRVVFTKRVCRHTTLGYGRTYSVPEDNSLVVTVPAGYADGYLRAYSDAAHVLIGGCRHRVSGRVSMDQFTVDLGPNGKAGIGDEVVLMGTQGEQTVGADELADLAGTIVYEVLCAISRRVPRIYRGRP